MFFALPYAEPLDFAHSAWFDLSTASADLGSAQLDWEVQERVQLPGQLEEGQSEFAVLDVEQPKHKWEQLTFIRNNSK